MPKTLLIEIQQASLVLFNVACLYTGIHWVLFRDRSKEKTKKIPD
ncbi:MAG: hypothetical protein ACOYK1_05065 [Vampirovibrionia bacterium]|jgi:hypothetical protein